MYLSKINQTEDNIQFQEGNCEFLARALYDEFHYPTIFVLGMENKISEENLKDILSMDYSQYQEYYQNTEEPTTITLIHCFSCVDKHNKTFYIDSTGITDDIDDILQNFNLSEIIISKFPDEFLILSCSSPYEIKDKHYSTYYDFYGDKDLEETTREYREKPAREFVEENKKRLDVDAINRGRKRKMKER